MIYDYLQFLFGILGVLAIVVACTQRNRERRLISFDYSVHPRDWRPLFRTLLGYRLAVCGALALSLSGLVGVIRVFVNWTI